MRRTLLPVLLFLAFMGSAGVAQQYPTRTISLIVPQSPGSTVDLIGRIVAQKFGEIGISMVVLNRTGALGEIGKRDCARAIPDGYTLCIVGDGPAVIVPALMAVAKQPSPESLAPIGFLIDQFYVLVVRKDLVEDFPAFVAHARAHPSALACGSGNIWGTLGISILNGIDGVTVRDIPYKRGEPEALFELKAGRIDCLFATLATTRPFIDSGDVRVLGTFGSVPNPFLRNVPSLSKWGYSQFAEFGTWQALFGPAQLPNDITVILNKKLHAVLEDPDVAAVLGRNWTSVRDGGTPEQVREAIDHRFEVMREFLCRRKVEINGFSCLD